MMIFGQTGRNEMIGVCQHRRWTRRGGQGEGLPYYDDDGDGDDDDESCHAHMGQFLQGGKNWLFRN